MHLLRFPPGWLQQQQLTTISRSSPPRVNHNRAQSRTAAGLRLLNYMTLAEPAWRVHSSCWRHSHSPTSHSLTVGCACCGALKLPQSSSQSSPSAPAPMVRAAASSCCAAAARSAGVRRGVCEALATPPGARGGVRGLAGSSPTGGDPALLASAAAAAASSSSSSLSPTSGSSSSPLALVMPSASRRAVNPVGHSIDNSRRAASTAAVEMMVVVMVSMHQVVCCCNHAVSYDMPLRLCASLSPGLLGTCSSHKLHAVSGRERDSQYNT